MYYKVVYYLFIAYILLGRSCTCKKIPAIIVFGDSSVDAGNNNYISTILKSNFEPYGCDFDGRKPTGRFSNGKLPTDFISQALGIKSLIPAYLDPKCNITDFATGVSFASAGTGYDNATSDLFSVIPLWKELEYYKEFQRDLRSYLGHEKANQVLSEAIYIISVGTNDFLEKYSVLSKWTSEYSVENYEQYLLSIAENFIAKLYKLGARKIAVAGLPPMGCLPLERTKNFMFGSGCVEEQNNLVKDFNEKLKASVAMLKHNLVGIKLVLSDTYDILWNIIHNPDSFGFADVRKACCGTGLFEIGYMCDKLNIFTCWDPNNHVFWDALHTTEKTNRIVADDLIKNYLSEFL
ncbi:hypothetical protein TanjilG_29665 [Lupinus angustifolius]|uniref:GDSL esterase/lipase n=2 Tax=Lupinus angustifolius TaxID=3871 RepID=A0A4P1R5Y1_LUPAN|nr:hypothetical protein TanjilG_29665 [Lupinus angustifolius]